ncbi:MAG: hypothetical protein Q9157_000733 [Trypethelium eluteriae]
MGSRTEYGRRLVPNVIDEIACKDPQREAFQIPRSDDPKDGWKAITFNDYANAINRSALEIFETCGKAAEDKFPTIAYIGPQDARYVVIMVAAVKAGYKALFISPRNSQEGQINLFEQTKCHIIAFPQSHHAMVQPWLRERDMKAVEVGSFESWFSKEQVPHVPYHKTFEQAEWEPFCVLHTSGSTGLPKPIVVRPGMLAICDAYHNFPNWQGYTHWVRAWTERSKRHFTPMPLFHAAALYVFIFFVVYWESPVALGIPERALSSDLVVECLNNMDVECAALPPSVLEDMSQSEECIAALKKLKLVVFGGVYFQPRIELWQYLIINSDLFGCEWRKADDDVYELVVVRKDKQPGLQGFFYTFPDLNEYSNNDLYKPHPTLPDHWIYYGRADNIIVFSNGEKLNPVTIEDIVQDHAQVKGALVVGSNRFQPALLLEPSTHPKGETEECEFIDSLWPLVVQANSETVAHGQIGRDFIAISNPDKPFVRTGKGTIQRAGTAKLYADEIDRLYENAEQGSHFGAPQLDVSSEGSLIESIQKTLESHVHASRLHPETDFFSAGIDSLQAMNASRLLRAGLKASGYAADSTSLSARAVYNNPTPRRLAQYILRSIIHGGGAVNHEDEERHEVQVMKALHEQYTRDLIQAKPGRPNPSTQNQTVLLTGSTGTLGSHLLDQLVRHPAVHKIICLNRAADGGATQQASAMASRGLAPPTSYAAKTEFHHLDASQPMLGLSADVYARLLSEADRMILAAWPVNFNLSTEAFTPSLHGVRGFADFAAAAEKRVAVVFVSSVATAERWEPGRGPVPEERLDVDDGDDGGGWRLPSNGYGRSKMVGSLILEEAARVGDFPAASIRVGQIAGPEAEAGAWPRQEWLPSLVASSLYLAALPRELGRVDRVDWTPVERVARLVLDVAGVVQHAKDAREISGYFHGVNPYAISWQELAPAVQHFYGGRIKELVSFQEWVGRLEKSQTDDAKAIDANPGLKILDTYQAIARDSDAKPVIFDMQRANATSPAMKEAGAITPELMKHWCTQWEF